MNYVDSQENLRAAFKQLAVAKQEFLMAGGELEFSVSHSQLHMKVTNGPHMSMPFINDEQMDHLRATYFVGDVDA